MRTTILAIVVLTRTIATAQQTEPKGRPNRRDRSRNTDANDPQGKGSVGGQKQNRFQIDVPKHSIGLSLGRLTKDSITISVRTNQDLAGNITYGTEKDSIFTETPERITQQGISVQERLDSLKASTRYYYRFVSRKLDAPEYDRGEENSFHTARSPSSTFTFVVQSDSTLGSKPHSRTLREIDA
jgi:hypothetical protein